MNISGRIELDLIASFFFFAFFVPVAKINLSEEFTITDARKHIYIYD